MRRTCWCIVALLVLPVVAQAAEPAAPHIDGLRLGFAGHYKIGYWTPVEVSLTGGDTQQQLLVELTVPDGDGVASQVTAPASVALASAEHRAILLYAKFGRPAGPITVTLRADDRTVAERPFIAPEIPAAILATREMVVAIGPAPDLTSALSMHRQDDLTKAEVVQLDSVAQLPDRWFGYEGVDTVVMTTSRPDVYHTLTPAQLEALDQWIRLGGRLVWGAAREAKTVLAESFPLDRFAPGTLEEMVPVRTAGLESYVVTADRLDRVEGANTRFRLEAPRLSHVRGRIEAYDGARPTDIPLVIREPRGLGEVVFAALDLELPPIARWSARGRLINQLLGFSEEGSGDESEKTSRQGLHAGYDDLSGQLRGTLDQFTSAPMIPFWIVGSLILLYILAIGPLDYYLVKNILRRMELTWITFPLWILGFSALALWAADRYKGHETRINQIDLVDVDQTSNLVRGTTWLNIFSPADASYDLTVEPSSPTSSASNDMQRLMSWFGLPGPGLGGMNSEVAAPPIEAEPYRFAPLLNALLGVPIRVWSTKPLMSRWSSTTTTDSPWFIKAQLIRDETNSLTGSLVNELRRSAASTDADVVLENCMLYYGRLTYSVGKLEPGRQISVTQLAPRTIEALVTRRHPVGDKDAATPYDPYDLNAARVLELMSFHDMVGGRKYTHLLNRYQHFVELSDELRLGRAILIGRFAEPVAVLSRDGKALSGPDDTRWTMFRFILPVAEAEPKK